MGVFRGKEFRTVSEVRAYWENFSTEIGYFCRKEYLLPKGAVSAETRKGQIRTERVSADIMAKLLVERPPKYPGAPCAPITINRNHRCLYTDNA